MKESLEVVKKQASDLKERNTKWEETIFKDTGVKVLVSDLDPAEIVKKDKFKME